MAFKIEFPRGDSYTRGFMLEVNGSIDMDPFDEIYFTVKKFNSETVFLFQKRLSTGGIIDNGAGEYELQILPEDTDGLSFGEYKCDIEFRRLATNWKKTFTGKMKLGEETTHHANE